MSRRAIITITLVALALGMFGAIAVAGRGGQSEHRPSLPAPNRAPVTARPNRAPVTARPNARPANRVRHRAPSAVAEAQARHEYPSPTPPPQGVARASASPTDAVRGFVSGYINWDAGSVAADMRGLAARSIGQARAAMQLAAVQTAGDYELQRGGVANRGAVEAVAPLPGEPGRYLVVTRELTTATAATAYQGLQPAWHVAIATVAQIARGRWVVSGWEPES